jgi:hypothetical protein
MLMPITYSFSAAELEERMATRVCTNYYRGQHHRSGAASFAVPLAHRALNTDASAAVPLIPRRSIDGRQGDGTNSIIGWTEQRIQS